MSAPIRFFKKSACDFEKAVVVTASEGQASASFLFDRSNRTAWGTSGSVDSNNTQIVVNMGDVMTIDSILLLKHNFKNFLLEYWDDIGLLWLGFATPIHPTASTDASSFFNFPAVNTSQLRLTIFGTQVANSDKLLCQFIATSQIGQLNGWPKFSKPTMARNLVQQQMLSGKSHILKNVGFYATDLTVENWSDDADLTIVEALYNSSEGFLFWPCGGDQTQFSSLRQGYRLEDIFLTQVSNEFSPEWAQGFYKCGMQMDISLTEVIT